MIQKKKYPLKVLSAINELKREKLDFIEFVSSENGLPVTFIDKEYNNYFFTINRYQVRESERFEYEITYNPYTLNHIYEKRELVEEKILKNKFNNWQEVIKIFNEADNPFEDEFIKFYVKELASYFELIDEDQDLPYPVIVQEKIEISLSIVEQLIINSPFEDIPNEEKTLLLQETTEIKRSISQSSRRKVFNSIIHLIAKLWKTSKPYAKKAIKVILIEGLKEFVKHNYQEFIKLLI